MADEQFANIRDIIGCFIGAKVVDITQHDQDYFREHGIGFIDLMFEDGQVLRFWSLHDTETMFTLNPECETPEDIERT